jgi:LCP family protein required for cell wall assembly
VSGDAATRRPGPARGAPNEESLLALGQAIDRRGGRRGRRRRPPWARALIWTGIGFGTIVILLVLALVADAIYLNTLPTRVAVDHLQTINGASENILLVGSTTRCGLKHQNAAYGICQQGVTGVNSDIVMVAHLDPNTHKVTLLSLPRDLFVPNARTTGPNKIDAALYQGPSQLAAVVEEDFGIPINHFVELNFDTFANVVNAIGGIDMYFPRRVYDLESGLNIERPGCYHLDGVHALQVVRARHLQYQQAGQPNIPADWTQESQSDLARIRRTHEFLRVVAARIASMGIANPISDQNLATAILPDLTIDSSFSEGHMVSLATTYAGTSIGTVPELTYPVVLVFTDPNDFYDYIWNGGNYGDVEFPMQPGGWQTVDSLFGATVAQNPWNDKPLPLAGAFHVSVMDGSGEPGQQATVATALDRHGFHVTQTGVVGTPASKTETVVYYGGPPPPKNGDWKSASLAAALRVESELLGPVTLGYDPAMVTRGDMVTVVTGSDLQVATHDLTVLPPPTTTTSTSSTSTSSTSSTTTTTSPVTATTVYDPGLVAHDPGLSAPTATAQPLEPWDPRACPANERIILQDRSGDG